MPKINIFYNKLIDPVYISYVHSFEKWKDYPIPTESEVISRVEAYNTAWKPIEYTTLASIQDTTGLSFTRNQIDVHIVSVTPRATSNPIVIKSGYTPDEFISVLIEELIHNLSSDNKEKWTNVWKKIVEKYSIEERATKNHILVFSIMKAIGITPFIGETPEYKKASDIADADFEWVISLFK